MTEKDLLHALQHVDRKYTEEAGKRAAAAAEKKPRGIVMRTAAVAVSAAACFGLILFGLAIRQDPEISVAESDTSDELSFAAQTEMPAAEAVTTVYTVAGTTAPGSVKGTAAAVTAGSGTGKAVTSGTKKTETSAAKTTETTAGKTEETETKQTAAAGPEQPAATQKSTAAAEPKVQYTEPSGLIYNLVPDGRTDYIPAAVNGLANNVYRAKPGEKLRIGMTVKNAPKISEAHFSFQADHMIITQMAAGDAYASAADLDAYAEDEIFSFLCVSGGNPADGSTVCSFTVDVPETPGRYTVTLTPGDEWNIPMIAVYSTEADERYKDFKKMHDFTFYGLDILVGDTAVPVPAQPVLSEPIYRLLHEVGILPSPDALPTYVCYDTLEEAGSKMIFAADSVTAHAGDKKVPVRVFIRNNTGFIDCGFRLICSPKLGVVLDDSSVPEFTIDPAYVHKLHYVSELADPYNGTGFSIAGGTSPNFTKDGTLVTFYFDIPEDAAAGDEFELSIELVNLDVQLNSNVSTPVTDACTVRGKISIAE